MKILTGTITSTKMQKTATVSVTRFVAHPLYRKRMRLVKKYHVHDEQGHKVGEMVDFVACAPISKSKKWRILEKNEVKAEKAVEKKAVKKVEKKTTTPTKKATKK